MPLKLKDGIPLETIPETSSLRSVADTASALARLTIDEKRKHQQQQDDLEIERLAKQTLKLRVSAALSNTSSRKKIGQKNNNNNKWTVEKWELKDRAVMFRQMKTDHLDESGAPIAALLPTDAGFDTNQMTQWVQSRKFSIVRYLVDTYFKHRRHWLMANFVESLRRYHQHSAELDEVAGKPRKTTWLNSFQSSLSLFRRQLKERQVPYFMIKYIRMTKEEKFALEKQKLARLEQCSENVVKIDGAAIVEKTRTFLSSDDPPELIIALAALTGRRASELIVSGVFGPPRMQNHERPAYWAHFTGILKQREWDRNKVVAREIPLLAPRDRINEALDKLRDLWPATTCLEANKLYSNTISVCVRKLFPQVAKLHNFRKTFCHITYRHFNDDLNFSLPRFASEVLGHKSIHGGRLLTYLNVNVANIDNITFH
jgi:integrase